MPEGDTLFRQASLLQQALGGQTLMASDFRVPSLATVDLAGMRVESVVSRGKHLLVRVEDLAVQSHLKMDGVWHLYPVSDGSSAAWRRPGHTARCVLTVAGHQAVGFALGQLRVLTRAQEEEFFADLGPDPLGPDWDPDEACRRLSAESDRPIGVALLDQRNLAGVGNVFRSEICFLARLRPETPVAEVRNMAEVVDLSHRLLWLNRNRSRRTTTGTPMSSSQYWVYGRARKRCLRCQGPVVTYELGDLTAGTGRQPKRAVYVCPHCQAS